MGEGNGCIGEEGGGRSKEVVVIGEICALGGENEGEERREGAKAKAPIRRV